MSPVRMKLEAVLFLENHSFVMSLSLASSLAHWIHQSFGVILNWRDFLVITDNTGINC